MPAPLLLARKSGFYCRVFVPADLRPIIGQRYLVRALAARDRDEARLIAAQMAITVAHWYRHLRKGLPMSDDLLSIALKALKDGTAREAITISGLLGKSNEPISVKLDSAKDLRDFKKEFGEVFKQGAAAPLPNPFVNGVYRLSPEYGVVISQRVAEFEVQQKDDNRTKKYIDECRRAIEILIGICGDFPPDDYTPSLVTEFKKRVKFLPKNPDKGAANIKRWSHRTHLQRSLTVEAAELPHIAIGTVNKHINRLSAFFALLKKNNLMSGANPFFERQSKKSKIKGGATNAVTERQAYTMDELNQIFDPALYRSRKLPHSFWPPLISLLTGARCNEIAQLYLDDIVDDDPENPGRWRFMILAKEVDQRVKTVNSLRSIPMHPKLIEMGFLTYLEDVRSLGYKRVFPTLRYTEASGYGDSVSEFYLDYLRDKVKITDSRKVFHSFRYYFCNYLFRKSQNERMHIVGMTGHQREGVFERTYAGELNYPEKMTILMKLALPDIKIEPYTKGRFIKYFKAYEANCVFQRSWTLISA